MTTETEINERVETDTTSTTKISDMKTTKLHVYTDSTEQPAPEIPTNLQILATKEDAVTNITLGNDTSKCFTFTSNTRDIIYANSFTVMTTDEMSSLNFTEVSLKLGTKMYSCFEFLFIYVNTTKKKGNCDSVKQCQMLYRNLTDDSTCIFKCPCYQNCSFTLLVHGADWPVLPVNFSLCSISVQFPNN